MPKDLEAATKTVANAAGRSPANFREAALAASSITASRSFGMWIYNMINDSKYGKLPRGDVKV